jgi:hypothetical protein
LLPVASGDETAFVEVSVPLATSAGGGVAQALRVRNVRKKTRATACFMVGMKLSWSFMHIVRVGIALSIG